METIHAAGVININEVMTKQGQSAEYFQVNFSIGNDDKIYCLFRRPELIDGKFISLDSHSRYAAYVFTVDWYSGDIYASQFMDFGVLPIDVDFLQPIRDKFLLLMRGRIGNDSVQNALIVDEHGYQHSRFCFGTAIEECIVDEQNYILTCYSKDFGEMGSIGAQGLVKWSDLGEKVWENQDHNYILISYGMNVDKENNLWFNYSGSNLNGSNLVKTDYLTDILYQPQARGYGGFLISQHQDALLFYEGYDLQLQEQKGFCIIKILRDNKLSEPVDCSIVFDNITIDKPPFRVRGSKAVFANVDRGFLYFLNWS